MMAWDIFLYFPKPGESFTAKWKDQKGTEHISELPAIKKTGVSMQVTISENKRNFIVYAHRKLHPHWVTCILSAP